MLKKAFSLVELMVTLIIVSILIAALSPVITKKLKSKEVTVGQPSGDVKMICTEFGPDCTLCYEHKCVVCNKTCLLNQALDISNCNCVDCASTFGDKCLKCAVNTCMECEKPYYVKDAKCEICPIGSYCDGTYRKTCPDGTYTDTEGQTQCLDCPVGSSCANGIKTPCEAGTYSEANASSCTICPKGYYCPKESDKIICASGTYQSQEGQTSCRSCAYLTEFCSVCNKETGVCETCNTDYKLDGNSCVIACKCTNGSCATGKTTCSSCNAGYYLNSGKCTKCPAGSYCQGGTTGKKSCTGCYCSSAGASQCTKSSLGICSNGICAEVDHTNCGWCDSCSWSTYYWRDGLCYHK